MSWRGACPDLHDFAGYRAAPLSLRTIYGSDLLRWRGPPAFALELVAEHANRPIIIASETFLGHGGIGGFLLLPDVIGQGPGRLAMRILAGEPASKIPVSAGDKVRPIFDWRQMQRWGLPASGLPQGRRSAFTARQSGSNIAGSP